MKKVLFLMLSALIFTNTSFAEPTIYEKPDVKIIVEGEELQLGEEVPIIVNSRTLVPLRKLVVGLGVPDNNQNIKWIGETREVKVNYNGVNIELAIDDLKGYINGKEYTLDSAPIIHRDRTYLPARFVGEALGYTISWDKYTPAVLVVSNEKVQDLTKILDKLNSFMDNVKTYEVSTLKTSNIENTYDGKTQKSSYVLTNLEKADLEDKIIYTENYYKDDIEESKNYIYNTENSYYGRYNYTDVNGENVDTGWKRQDYSLADEENPFECKERLAIINIDSSLYGCLLYNETSNSYIVTSTSNHLDILKSLNGSRLFDEIFDGNVKNLNFELEINKKTSIPEKLTISLDKVVEMTKENEGYDFYSIEKIEYTVDFLGYNKNLKLELPKV